MQPDKIVGNAWLAYSIGLYAFGHPIAGTLALGFALLMIYV